MTLKSCAHHAPSLRLLLNDPRMFKYTCIGRHVYGKQDDPGDTQTSIKKFSTIGWSKERLLQVGFTLMPEWAMNKVA